jgi:uncharacterized protein YuzE
MIRTYDKTANASYTVLNETSNRTVAKTVQVSDKCNIDIDKDGFPIGVEVLF